MSYRRDDDRGYGGRRDDDRGRRDYGSSRDYGRDSGGKGGYNDRDRGGGGGYNDRGGSSFDRGGKGSSYRDYQPQRSGGNDRRGGKGGRTETLEGARQRGVIASVKDQFGFIECEERDERLFFHFTEIEDTRHCPAKGDCVSFGIAADRRDRAKTSACQIEILPAGSVKLEEEMEGRFEGVIVKELKGGRPQDAHGGQIQLTSGSNETEVGDPDSDDVVMFNGVDLANHRWQPFVGDKVELTIVKKLGKKRARKVTITAPGGPGREQGTISTIKDSFGFVECCDRSARLFFHFSELFDNVAPQDLRVGDEVEFSAKASDRHGQDNCARVKLLPKGTISFETELEGRWRGEITKELRAPPNQNRNRNRNHDDRDGGKGGRPEQKATGKITLDASESQEENQEEAAADVEEPAETAAEPDAENVSTSSRKSKGGQRTVLFEAPGVTDEAKLIVGDKVELTLVVNKRTQQQQASKIVLITPNPNRERGIVCSIRDRGEAQIRCADRAERVSCLATDEKPLEVGDEVEFNVIDLPGGRFGAVRPEVLPSGSVVLDEVVEGQQKGKIVKLDMAREDKWSSRAQEVAIGGQVEIIDGPDGLPARVSFVVKDCPTLDGGSLMAGDILEFKMVKELRNGKFTALDMVRIQMAADNREQGVVATVKENFGFIKCADRDIRIFFHFSEWRGERMLREGDEVEFNSTSRDGKETAARLVMLPKGTVVFEIPLEGRFVGTVKTEAKRGHPGGKGFGGKGGGESAGAGIISVDAEAIEAQKAALLGEAVSAAAEDEPAAEEGANNQAAPSNDDGADGEASEAPEASQIQIKFRLEDVDDRATPYCGDKVEFSLVLVKRNNALQAKHVKLLPKAGRVTNMRGRQGFIQHKGFSAHGKCELMDTMFYMDDVTDNVVLKSGDEVEFIVCFDQRNKCSKCISIRRTKEAPACERPQGSRMLLQKKSVATGSTLSKAPDKDSDGHSLIGFAFGSYGRMRKDEVAEPEPEPENEDSDQEEGEDELDGEVAADSAPEPAEEQ